MNEATAQFTEALIDKFPLAIMAFIIAMALTPIFTYFAYKYKFWKKQKTVTLDGKELIVMNKLHETKLRRNIPTMAGVIFVVTITAITLIFNLSREQTWLPLAALLGAAAVGLIDDIMNVRSNGKGAAGMRATMKFLLITILSLWLGWFFFSKLGYTGILVPLIGEVHVGWLIIPIFAFTVIATGNAVNISDGQDGLSGGLSAIAFSVFAVIALAQQQFGIMGFCITIVGALLAYLWFNVYPARFFMGDVGSFALGCSLAVVAMLTNTLFLLPIIGFVFVVDTGTVIIQQFSKKFFHRKIWLSTPIHHHFEAIGWPETKVTARFWLIGIATGAIGLILALMEIAGRV